MYFKGNRSALAAVAEGSLSEEERTLILTYATRYRQAFKNELLPETAWR